MRFLSLCSFLNSWGGGGGISAQSGEPNQLLQPLVPAGQTGAGGGGQLRLLPATGLSSPPRNVAITACSRGGGGGRPGDTPGCTGMERWQQDRLGSFGRQARRWWCTEAPNPREAGGLWDRPRRLSLPAATLRSPLGPPLAGPAGEEEKKWWCIQVSLTQSIAGERRCVFEGRKGPFCQFLAPKLAAGSLSAQPGLFGAKTGGKKGIVQSFKTSFTSHLCVVVVLFVGWCPDGLFSSLAFPDRCLILKMEPPRAARSIPKVQTPQSFLLFTWLLSPKHALPAC